MTEIHNQAEPMSDFFEHGSRWVRADFHLHTHADKEFPFPDADTRSFKKEYVKRLKEEAVHVGVITNHNKFDLAEYKSVRKTAINEQIYLLPGVELSVNDGAQGIHCLIAFDFEAWITSDEDFINQFLTAAFEGTANRENENTSCNYNLQLMLQKLEEHRQKGRDSFVILAHVHDKSGFFNEMNGGRIKSIAQRSLFKKTVLGCQKFRKNEDVEKVKNWLGGKMPALLEGSDCKCIEEVGRAHTQNGADKKCYLKIGAFTFEAVKFALIHHEERVRNSLPAVQDLYIRTIEIERESESLTIPLSPDLNTLIGVRGSGKSSLLETVRFGLGLELNQTSKDYKNKIVRRFLGAGNRLLLHLSDAYGNTQYTIRREWGKRPEVLDAMGEHKEDLLPVKLLPTAYYGQKDIEELGEGFKPDYVEGKLLKEHLAEAKAEEAKLVEETERVFGQLERISDLRSQREEVTQKIAHLELEIKQFEASGLQELVAKELNFADDETKLDQIGNELEEMSERLLEVVESYGWESYLSYRTKEPGNAVFFEKEVFPIIQELVKTGEEIQEKFSGSTSNGSSIIDRWEKVQTQFNELRESLQEEFRQAKQRINNPNVDVETHKQNKQALNREQTKLKTIDAKLDEAQNLEQKLAECLSKLEAHRREMFEIINSEIQKLNDLGLSFRIEATYQGDKDEFKKWLAQNTNRLHRDNHARRIAEYYDNPIQIYRDLHQDDSELATILSGGSLLPNFREAFSKDVNLLTWPVPNKYEFFYNDKPLENYSIGQKSTALIAFVLAHEDKKLFIIDQPEDDLDNHTVAKEIIGRIRQLKPSTQFIFATHNPNILVLGDSEQVVICEYHDDEDSIQSKYGFKYGSIDSADIQQTAINIMEGGQEAFDRRKNVYQLWKR